MTHSPATLMTSNAMTMPMNTMVRVRECPRLGAGMYRSEDGGASWDYVNRFNNRPFYYSHIWMDPQNDQRVYVLSGSAQISEDGGRTFARSMEGISGDFHALNQLTNPVTYFGS